jgi:ABC-type arginine/histidine transport system permease subunit
MQVDAAKLFALADRIKTPLALAGAVVVALYLIYRQVLSLGIFSTLGSQPTFLVVQSIIDKLFWLAVLALVLGVCSYLAVAFRGNRGHPEGDAVKFPVRKKRRD